VVRTLFPSLYPYPYGLYGLFTRYLLPSIRKLVERGEIKDRRDPPPFPLAYNLLSKPFFNLSNLYQTIALYSAISAISSSISRVLFKIYSIYIITFQIPISIRLYLTGHTPLFPSLKQISKRVTTYLQALQIYLDLRFVLRKRFK
jgi:hypothetical protein